jgi:hypothetical protein
MGEVLGTPGSVGKYHLARAPIFHPTEETSSHREELIFGKIHFNKYYHGV